MRTRIDPPAALLILAAAQSDVVSTEQCAGHGLGRHSIRRLVDEGRWQRLTPGAYFVRPGTPPWLSLAWTGVLLGGDHARLARHAAGHLQGICADGPELIELYVLGPTRRVDRECWSFRLERPGVRLRTSRGDPPCTEIEDTVLDLCADADEAEAIDIVSRALHTRRTSKQRMRRRLADRARVANRRLLVAVLADVAEGAESPLEVKYLRDVERAHRLPTGQRQSRRGRNVRDVLYDEFATVVELDGRLGHEGLGRFRDMERDNLALVAGESTLRFGWRDVHGDPCRVAGFVAAVLAQRGWTGSPGPCPRCRRSLH